MKTRRPFLILGTTPHRVKDRRIYAYGPYVKEINLWLRLARRPAVVLAPLEAAEPRPIDISYEAADIKLECLPRFNVVSLPQALRTVRLLPSISARILCAMIRAGHIHIRCPSNVGLLALIFQVFFPGIPKTVKYAGNWYSYPGEPWSYRLQKMLACSRFWCRRTRILAYGPACRERPHIVSSFAASYTEAEARTPLSIREPPRKDNVRLLFVGSLTANKRPLVAVQACQQLRRLNCKARLDLLGDGPERDNLERYVRLHGLGEFVFCHGNVPSHVVSEHHRRAHFLLLLSESEGWPKAVTEAMFWGTVPIATPVGCVPMILDGGRRGVLVEPTSEDACEAIMDYIEGRRDYRMAAENAAVWSRRYTLEALATSIRDVLASLENEHEGAANH